MSPIWGRNVPDPSRLLSCRVSVTPRGNPVRVLQAGHAALGVRAARRGLWARRWQTVAGQACRTLRAASVSREAPASQILTRLSDGAGTVCRSDRRVWGSRNARIFYLNLTVSFHEVMIWPPQCR